MKQERIGPIILAPGIPRKEVFIFLTVAAIASMMASFLNVMQPFVFTEVLGVPKDSQGQLAGQLMTVQQICIFVTVGFAGALADRVGRKLLLILALLGYAVSAFTYPLLGSVFALFLLRAFYGVSSTLHTASAPPKFFDYPDNRSRGKFMALVMIYMAIIVSALVAGIGAKLPGWFSNLGANVVQAGTYTLWMSGGVAVLFAVIAARYMMPDKPTRTEQAENKGLRGFMNSYHEIWACAKEKRGFATLFISSFVVRADDAVVASFFALWVTIKGAQEGLGTLETLKIAAYCAAIIRIMNLVVPPIMGPLLDRYSRLFLYIGSIVGVGVVFSSALMIDSVAGWEIFAFAVAVGIVENSQHICQQSLFGQEAPPHLRGTAYGVLAIFGTGGVILTSLVAGVLFDKLGPAAPFVLIGGLHLLAALICVATLVRMARRASG